MKILKPFFINKIKLNNRITVAPMCQYSAINGNPSNWHYGHLHQLAISGAGLLSLESTAVNLQGRITSRDLMLATNDNAVQLKKLFDYIKNINNIPISIQISHSGRKGSAEIPWIKSNSPLIKKKWISCAPSAIKKDQNWPIPKELSVDEIKKIINDFKSSSLKAKKIGFDSLEIHMAHGYLLHQFFSPISNHRKDAYGGNLENRCRFLFEISEQVRKIWPKDRILGARVSGDDWLSNGANIKDCVYLVKILKQIGLDYVCVSSGGIINKTNLKFKEGYQVHLAKKIKKEVKIITRSGGMLSNFNYAKKLIENKSVDLINIARRFINEPTWLLKVDKNSNIPNQYKRCL